jgi:RimJ/RimL family protein N-acetyltransferase
VTPVTRRPERDADIPFLLALYRWTREQELALVDWTDSQKDDFIAMQFNLQREHYHREYANARFEILESDGVPIGRLYVHERLSEIRVMDIALVPSARNRGLGSKLLGEILTHAANTSRTVTIHVERFNPALRLYERLGFRPAGEQREDSIYLFLEARPAR